MRRLCNLIQHWALKQASRTWVSEEQYQRHTELERLLVDGPPEPVALSDGRTMTPPAWWGGQGDPEAEAQAMAAQLAGVGR